MAKKKEKPEIVVQLREWLDGQRELTRDDRIVLGIDPGIEGAITIIVHGTKRRTQLKIFDIPTTRAERRLSAGQLAARKKQARKKKQKKKVKTTTTRAEYDYKQLADFFQFLAVRAHKAAVSVLIEKVVVSLYRPGAKRCFACKRMFGQSPYTGVAVGMANAMWPIIMHTHGWQFNYVIAQTWKKYFSLINRNKDAARSAAAAMLRGNAVDFQRVKDHNRAESALIACYGLRNPEVFRGNVSVSVGDEVE